MPPVLSTKRSPVVIDKYFPNSKIIIDRFHVTKCLTKCIDKTRRRLQKLISKERSEKLKNLRWIILKNNEDLIKEEKEKLEFAFECSKGIKPIGFSTSLNQVVYKRSSSSFTHMPLFI